MCSHAYRRLHPVSLAPDQLVRNGLFCHHADPHLPAGYVRFVLLGDLRVDLRQLGSRFVGSIVPRNTDRSSVGRIRLTRLGEQQEAIVSKALVSSLLTFTKRKYIHNG